MRRDCSDGFNTDYLVGTRFAIIIRHCENQFLIAEPHVYYWLSERVRGQLEGLVVLELIDRAGGFVDEDRGLGNRQFVGGLWKVINPETK